MNKYDLVTNLSRKASLLHYYYRFDEGLIINVSATGTRVLILSDKLTILSDQRDDLENPIR